MSPDPAQEHQRLETVKRALKALRKGAALAQYYLFPEGVIPRNLRRAMLAKLVRKGAVVKTLKDGEKGIFYRVQDVAALDAILATDEAVSDFIWSSEEKEEEKMGEVLSIAEAPGAPVLTAAPPTASSDITSEANMQPPLDPKTIEETNRLLGKMLSTMEAALQGVVYVKDEIAAMRAENKDLRTKVEELLDLWSK